MSNSNVVKLDSPVVGFKLVDTATADLTEKTERPHALCGTTYKLKTHLTQNAFYITINDIVLNANTPQETRRPFEIFFNSKNVEHYQWMVALTRIMSGVFRKGGDCTFLVEELKSVFDPRGGYFKGRQFIPSMLYEVGEIVEKHLVGLGMLPPQQSHVVASKTTEEQLSGAVLCHDCLHQTLVRSEGCWTCLNCGASKCG